MNTNAIIQKLSRIPRGSFFTMRYTSDVPLLAQAKREGYVVYKSTTTTARWGVNYNNISTVRARFGEAPVKHELPWGQWVEQGAPKNMLISHKDKLYLRFYTTPNKSNSTYYVNGQPISKEGLMALGIVQPSYWKKDGEPSECMTIRTENIEHIGNKASV